LKFLIASLNSFSIKKNSTKPVRIYIKILKIHSDINMVMYGNQNKYRNDSVQIIDNLNIISAEAMPNGDIVISTGFIFLLQENIFSDDELVAFLCHESSHVLNDDWGHKIMIKNTNPRFFIDIKIDSFPRLGKNILLSIAGKILLGYLGRATGISSKKTSALGTALNSFSYNASVLHTSNPDFKSDYDLIIPNLLNSQGFGLDTELTADAMAIDCLTEMKINNNALISLLKKLNNLPFVDKEQMEKRIENVYLYKKN